MATPRWPEVQQRPERAPDLSIISVGVRQPRRMLGLLGPLPPTEVRVFSDEALRRSMDKVLASLPPDSKAAEVGVGFDAGGVQVVGVYKTAGGWSILAGVSYERGGQWGGSVSARKVWS